MIQKRLSIFSTKVNRSFYEMVKVHVIIIQKVIIFTIYETLFGNFKTILPVTYQNETSMHGKRKTCLVYL